MKNKKDYNRILNWAKKVKAIDILGGKCEKCGDENIFHLTYHHKYPNDKEFDMANIRDNKWSKIEKELNKCVLLCYNCHSEYHKLINNKNNRYNNNKKLFLDFKNVDSCNICGYNKYNGSLHFHHEKDKNFTLKSVSVSYNTVDELTKNVVDELNKCIVLCANCHQEHHTNYDNFFENNKEEIYKKSKNIKDKMSKIDRNVVEKMYFDENKRQIDIVNFFGCKKGTISEIIKNLKINRTMV